MKGFNFFPHILLASLMSILTLSNANANEKLKMNLVANQVIKNDLGTITYVPVRTAPVGAVIQYRVIYSNIINKDIKDLAIVLPVPANMTFTGEAYPSSAQASIDGRNYGDIPLMRKVEGKMVKIPFSEYRTLRWNIKLLPAQKSAAVALNMIVN